MSALLCRQWRDHVKGRDWYDLVWFVARRTPVRLRHLHSRLVQADSWSAGKELRPEDMSGLLSQRIDQTDFVSAREDVLRFVNDPATVELWSPEFFHNVAANILSF